MGLKIKVLSVLLVGLTISITLPSFITSLTHKKLSEKSEISYQGVQTLGNELADESKKDTGVPVVKVEAPVVQEEVKQEEPVEDVKEEVKAPAPKVEIAQVETAIPYENMTLEQLINSIANGTFKLEVTAPYNTNANKLTKSKGAIYYNNHKETYYSQRVLPGTSLNIPGRHVADDGTIRDGEGYICVAANSSYLSKGSIVKTSLGPAKVYDSGCASGIIDIYTNW